jgi:hypothetical protein
LKLQRDLQMGIYISPVSPFQFQGKELMIDERAIPPAGRIGETEDLIGSVFVKDGKVRSLTTATLLGSVM